MTVKEECLKLLTDTHHRTYVYISDRDANLSAVNIHCLENADIYNTTTKIVLTKPSGIKYCPWTLDGIFVDQGAVSDEALSALNLKPNGLVFRVNPDTGEVL